MESLKLCTFSTARLILVPTTSGHIEAELVSPEHLSSMLNAEVGPGWPPGEYDRGAQEFFRDRLLEGGESLVGWYSWYAIRPAQKDKSAVVVAAAGFFGPPNEKGIVEIGYSVLQAFQNQGYATEIVKAFVSIALCDPRVQQIIARTTLNNLASIAVLKHAYFVQVGNGDKEGNIHFKIDRESMLA